VRPFERVHNRFIRRELFRQDSNVGPLPKPLDGFGRLESALVIVENGNVHDQRTAIPAISIM
jgi:hypothetical protein